MLEKNFKIVFNIRHRNRLGLNWAASFSNFLPCHALVKLVLCPFKMSGHDGEIFAFDSPQISSNFYENVSANLNSIENVNLTLTDENESSPDNNLISPLNYQTARRIEQAKTMLRNHSLLVLQSIQTDESICLIRARLLAKLSPSWSPEIENKMFNQSGIDDAPIIFDYTIVTPSNTFIEFDNVRSFASSFSTVNNSYKSHSSYSSGSFKSPDRMKFNKN